MRIVVDEMPKTRQECCFSQIESNGGITCILDNHNRCDFICENTQECPALISIDEVQNQIN